MKVFYDEQLDSVFQDLDTSVNGLSDKEAAVRQEKYGPNALAEGKRKSLLAKFFAQFQDVMIIVLLVAAAISGILAVIEHNYADLVDSGIILAIVLLNAIIGLVQENKAEAAMDALKNMSRPYAKVIRDGVQRLVKSEELVTGDLVVLEAGDSVPADMRLIESASLKIEESALTGESVPVEKDASLVIPENAPLGDRVNMAYSSGAVTYGRGKGIVTAIGMDTEVGKIAGMLAENEEQETPLQQQLDKTAKLLSIIVIVIAVIIFGANVIRAYSSLGTVDVDSIIAAFMTAVAIAVAAIPEGLPAVVTIVLAMGVQKMAKRQAIVKNLPSVETLGCCEIICSDKTGTLTLNRMTVRSMWSLDKAASAEDALKDGTFDLPTRVFALCNDTQEGDKSNLLGDPTETALVQYLLDRGSSYAELRATWQRVDELPFDSDRKLMTTVNKSAEETVAHVKGAPDMLIPRCTRIWTTEGIRPITDEDIAKIIKGNSDMASQALRVLASAIKIENLDDRDNLEQNLVFVGLVGMIDPPRPEVKEAVRVCKQAGMRPLMITGDHKDTAAAIARDIGILEHGQKVMTGAEIDALSDETFAEIIEEYSVFARVSPENKVRIVKAYKAKDRIVAMTGDGVNDAPSIKAADIGIGMGITGTDVSKGAADMVLADDNFATIIGAVEEGRKIYANIKKAVQFLLSANIAEVLCLFVVSVFMGKDFLSPVMILWVNLVTDSLPALALGVEAAERDVMSQKPRKAGGSLFAGKTGIDIGLQGSMQTVLVLASYLIGVNVYGNEQIGITMAFVSLAVIQLFHAYNMRSQTHSIFNKRLFANRLMNLSFVVGAVLMVLVMTIPAVRNLFGTVSLTGMQWFWSVVCAFGIIPLVEIEKVIEGKFGPKTK